MGLAALIVIKQIFNIILYIYAYVNKGSLIDKWREEEEGFLTTPLPLNTIQSNHWL
jgi:hypothetical protein